MLKRVSIQNFKSLKDVTLDLQKVNLLIGPNNSGKTNFLKALEFCYTSHQTKEVELEIEPEYEQGIDKLTYIAHDITNSFKHLDTAFKKNPKQEIYFQLLFNDKTQAQIEWSAEASRINHEKGNKFYGTEDSIMNLRETLGEIIIYKPDPNKLIQSGPVGTGAESVNSNASNLIGFLDRMLGNKYRKTVFNRIEEDLQICIPEFDEINIDDDASPTEELKRLFPNNSFKRLGLTNSKQGITYWADELSEGTLYFLALLCIINQPNPPKLLLLEEPEKGIHPRRIREVMDFIFRLAEEKDVQIILTTHNEHVLDDFATRPESVFVFDKDEEGATYVRNLQTDIIEPTNQRHRELGLDEIDLTTNLSENWLYGLLGGVPSIP